jgi:L-threonylcarbamoyladenylate synthase
VSASPPISTHLTRSVPDAAAVLRGGGLVAFPTETVYGLGASALDDDAVRAVFAAKGRPSDNPLIVHVASIEAVEHIAELPPDGRRLLAAFAPGPLTLVLPSRGVLPASVTAGGSTVAVRIPDHALALALIEAAGVPLVAPSANRSGRPSPTTWQAVRDDLDGRIDAILQGEPTRVGLESTVVDVTGAAPLLLRPGALSLGDLRAVVPGATRLDPSDAAASGRSPGLRHRHYAPNAVVRIVEQPQDLRPASSAAFIGLSAPRPGYGLAVHCADAADYARRVFSFFRQAEDAGMKRIDAEAVPETGVGAALMDRLRRAAAG